MMKLIHILGLIHQATASPKLVCTFVTILAPHFVMALLMTSKRVKELQAQSALGERTLGGDNPFESDGLQTPRKELLRGKLPSPPEQLFTYAAAYGSIVRFRKAQVVFRQGSIPNTTFALRQGFIKLATRAEDGREVIIEIIGAGDLLGEDALLSDESKRRYSAICITDAEALQIDSERLSQALKGKPEIAHLFMVYLLGRARGLQEHLANCLLNTGKKRLFHTLMANRERFGHLPRMNQQTLAEMIGMTRQYVNGLLREFRRSQATPTKVRASAVEAGARSGKATYNLKNHAAKRGEQ